MRHGIIAVCLLLGSPAFAGESEGLETPLAAEPPVIPVDALAGVAERDAAPPEWMDVAPEPAPGRFFQVRNQEGYRAVVTIAGKAGVDWRWIEKSAWNRARYFDDRIADNLRKHGGLSLTPKYAPFGSETKPLSQSRGTGTSYPLLWLPSREAEEPSEDAGPPFMCLTREMATRGEADACPADLSKYARCAALPDPPDPFEWLDDVPLERIRNQTAPGTFRLKQNTAEADSHALLNQFLARWSCREKGHNLLQPASAGGAFAASRRFTRATADAIEAFQRHAGIASSAAPRAVDLATLHAMDAALGVPEPAFPGDPPALDAGDEAKVQGRSAAAPSQTSGTVVASIFFTDAGTDLDGNDLAALDGLAKYYSENGATFLGFAIRGHADRRDEFFFNRALGEARVDAVHRALVARLARVDIPRRTVRLFVGEVERPQIGSSVADLRRFRRVDVELAGVSKDACWRCTQRELESGIEEVRPGCSNLLRCQAQESKEHTCDPKAETATEWSISGEISGICVGDAGAGGCAMTGDLFLRSGETSRKRRCRAQYSFVGTGVSGGFSLPVLCDVSLSKLSRQVFHTAKPVSFDDFVGEVSYLSAGLSAGIGVTRDEIVFDDVGRKRGIAPPRAIWPTGFSTGGLSCSISAVTGKLERREARPPIIR
jgi:outer membrane protein OmpA-like peptidoglycan-associated protein